MFQEKGWIIFTDTTMKRQTAKSTKRDFEAS